MVFRRTVTVVTTGAVSGGLGQVLSGTVLPERTGQGRGRVLRTVGPGAARSLGLLVGAGTAVVAWRGGVSGGFV